MISESVSFNVTSHHAFGLVYGLTIGVHHTDHDLELGLLSSRTYDRHWSDHRIEFLVGSKYQRTSLDCHLAGVLTLTIDHAHRHVDVDCNRLASTPRLLQQPV